LEFVALNHTLFISDLHLESDRPDITTRFITFLEHMAPQADAIYILGDLFESWIGDDNASAFNQKIFNAIQRLTQNNIPVYFMRGNRDFLIGQTFALTTGCIILPDPTVIKLYDRHVLLTHGDMLCTDDQRHQQFRHYAHNPKYNRFFLWLPLFLRRWLARNIRKASKKHTRSMPMAIMDVTPRSLEKMMRLHQVQQLIHGHTHRPGIHSLMLDEQSATRIVLGDWDRSGSVLVYQENGEYELVQM
jgi:UDP-2,3-diacylglucosamine hydrolase